MTVLTTRVTWRKPKQLTAGTRTPDLTDDEVANVRAALRVLRQRVGGYRQLAVTLGVNLETLKRAGSRRRIPPSVGLALRAARLAGVPLEEVLSGAWPKPGTCPTCGHETGLITLGG